MLRHRNAHRHFRQGPFTVKANDGGFSLAPESLRLAVQLDEINRRTPVRWMRYAILHARTNEGEVRIAVARLNNFLCVAQLRSKIDLIVPVLGSFGKQRAECMKELRQQVVAVVHAQRKASIEISG